MVTVKALLEDEGLELRVRVAGRAGALDKPVAWVHSTELPDPSRYVRPRELVLTNGLWADRVSAAEFVASVARAQAAGIVFGLRAECPATPDELIGACEDADVPLLEISAAVPFTEISQAMAARYTEERQGALVGLVRRGEALATAISQGAGASGVLRVLRRDHELPLAVVDRLGRLLASDGAELDAVRLQAVADGLARRPPPLELDLGDAGRAALYLVGAVGEADAALVCLRAMRDLTRPEQDALDQAARFLSLEVAKKQAMQAIEQRFAGELLEMVLSGGARAAEVPGRLRAFGVDAEGPLAVWALAFSGTEGALPGLAEAAGEFFASAGVPAAVAGGSRDVVAVMSWRHDERESARVAERLAAAVAGRFPGRRPVVGLGGVVRGVDGLRESLVRAREACRALRHVRPGPAVRTFAEIGAHRLLLSTQDAETLRTLAGAVLAPLRDHDAGRGGELERTLRAFLDHDGHWSATAEALHVHVNTLRNRLAKVTELTGRDVARTADRVDLFLALQAAAMG
ncbi:PucR family transcriptional regulator [Actinomadura verrucosospora]|uniref:Regulatory protein n=1 Tax=Actinomadura verrucosospora TaxID=46165 RepID=A0A7D3ZN07_ACTVE|nr:PucR family transcriptional regulator [Actinomadura verrucosospora]QKG22402.1 regulatory protein [Actinomadura verrucosospora]